MVLPALVILWALGMGLTGMSEDFYEVSQTWLVLSIIGFVLEGLLWLAVIGFFVYIALRIVAPRTADRLRDMIKGRPADA